MKLMTILGTRPEIIRLSRIIPKLDQSCEHILVNTGQNFDPALNQVFFKELDLRRPDHVLQCRGKTPFAQIGKILSECERVMATDRPERLLILGDTNSGLAALVAKRQGIPVYHMEAGNRCRDDRVPEEVNRRVIDHSSDVLMPYTERSRQNLVSEGIAAERIYVTGNPIKEVLNFYSPQIGHSNVLAQLGIKAGHYFLVTMHRAENVDQLDRLKTLTAAFSQIQADYGLPVIISTHPHTKFRLQELGLDTAGEQIRYLPPFGFFDFISLEKQALCVLSDSGTVQEECAIFEVPNVTIRDVTERPETVECGSNMLSGAGVESILRCVNAVLGNPVMWQPPAEYGAENVSEIVSKIILGYRRAAWC